MSAQLIFDLAPLGSVVRYFDGAPRPASRFGGKLAAWRSNNGEGRLVRRVGARRIGDNMLPAGIVLQHGKLDTDGSVIMVLRQTFSVASRFLFEVVEPPAIGSVRVVDRVDADAELLHLAADRAGAEDWLACNPHRRAFLDEVTATRWRPIWSGPGSRPAIAADTGRAAG
ncbi:hypothetical protein LGH82_28590 [Mesorhizobium sp. PAMC28654]|uniref:hypothetical protein n=1 Tax=Mesorhizobium sp. PAMC28654 TaxID=2880934 RepID=UPI001D09D078|nr:hypothetical protein [Mesorhizobium sp. PAMC28654]UDL89006.1 hypothetical protein LGH82_28590 [Mesorhizobium sp. PAMC28654]